MKNFFEEKIRNGSSLNSDAIHSIYMKQKRNEAYILFLELLKIKGFLIKSKIDIDALDLVDGQKRDINVLSDLVTPKRGYSLSQGIIRILHSGFLQENLLNVLISNYSLWDENKEKIWELIENDELYIEGLPVNNSLWKDKKDKIWQMILNDNLILQVLPPNNSLWEERKDEIWEIIKKNILKDIEEKKYNKGNLIGFLPDDSSLWNDKEEEIWELIQKERNLLSVVPKKCNLWEKRKEELKEIDEIAEYLHFFPENSTLWEDVKDKIWDFILLNNEAIIDLPNSSSLWSEKTNEIIEIFKNRPDLINYLSSKNILWVEKEDELWDIILKIGSITYLQPDNELWIKKADEIVEIILQDHSVLENMKSAEKFWRYKGEDIWNIFPSDKLFLIVHMPKNIPLWEEKKDEIWQLAQTHFSIISMLPPNHSLFKEKKEEIWSLVKTKKISVKYIIGKADWIKEKKEEIFELANSKTNKAFLAQIVDFNDILDFRRYIDQFFYLENRNGRRLIPINDTILNREKVLKESNPLSIKRLEKELLSLTLSSKDKNCSSEVKKILEMVLFRLNDLGALDKAIAEDNSEEIFGVNQCDNINALEIMRRINSLSDEKEIIYYALFYINKLTKLNNITIYLNAIKKDFYYDKEKDDYIDVIKRLGVLREKFFDFKDSSVPGKFYSYMNDIIENENYDISKFKKKELRDVLNEIKSMRATIIEIKAKYGDTVLKKLDINAITELNAYYNKREKAEKDATTVINEFRALRSRFYNEFGEDFEKVLTAELSLVANGNLESEIHQKIMELSNTLGYSFCDVYDSFVYAEYAIEMQDKLYRIKEMLLSRYIFLDREKVRAYEYEAEEVTSSENVNSNKIYEEGLIPYDEEFDFDEVTRFLTENGIDINNVTQQIFNSFSNPKKVYENWLAYTLNECVKNKRANDVKCSDFSMFQNQDRAFGMWKKSMWFKGKITTEFERELLKNAFIELEDKDLYKDYENNLKTIKDVLRKVVNDRYLKNGSFENIEETINIFRETLRNDVKLKNIEKKDLLIDVMLNNWKKLYMQLLEHEQKNKNFGDQEVSKDIEEQETEQNKDILFVYSPLDILPNAYHCNRKNIESFESCVHKNENNTVEQDENEVEETEMMERIFFRKNSRQIAFPFTVDEIKQIKLSFKDVLNIPFYWITYSVRDERALPQDSRGENGTGILTMENVTAAGNILTSDLTNNLTNALEINGE